MLQQRQRIRGVTPLPLRLAAGETRGEFLGEVAGMFVLFTTNVSKTRREEKI
jgi:hypothetical protein